MTYVTGFIISIIMILVLGIVIFYDHGLIYSYSKSIGDLYSTAKYQQKRADSLQAILKAADHVAIVHDLEEPIQMKDYVYIPANVAIAFKVGDTISACSHVICNECEYSRFYVITHIVKP